MKIQINHTTFEVDPNENQTFWEHINSGIWESFTFQVLDHALEETMCFLDVGAWAGPVSLYAAKNGAKVYSFEPDIIVFEQLKENVLLNPTVSETIFPYSMAIANKEGEGFLHARSGYGQSSSSLLNRTYDKIHSQKVKTTTLSRFVEEYQIQKVDFLKMDIEGGEFEVLKSIKPFLDQHEQPDLLISFHLEQLVEHEILKQYKSVLLSKIVYKLWRSGMVKQQAQREVIKIIGLLSDYPFIYDENGKLTFEEINALVNKGQNFTFYFSKRKWDDKEA